MKSRSTLHLCIDSQIFGHALVSNINSLKCLLHAYQMAFKNIKQFRIYEQKIAL